MNDFVVVRAEDNCIVGYVDETFELPKGAEGLKLLTKAEAALLPAMKTTTVEPDVSPLPDALLAWACKAVLDEMGVLEMVRVEAFKRGSVHYFQSAPSWSLRFVQGALRAVHTPEADQHDIILKMAYREGAGDDDCFG